MSAGALRSAATSREVLVALSTARLMMAAAGLSLNWTVLKLYCSQGSDSDLWNQSLWTYLSTKVVLMELYALVKSYTMPCSYPLNLMRFSYTCASVFGPLTRHSFSVVVPLQKEEFEMTQTEVVAKSLYTS